MTGFRSHLSSLKGSLWRQHADAVRQRAGCGSSFIKSMLRGEQYSTSSDTATAKVTADMVSAG